MFAARRGPYVQPVTARWAVTVKFISSTNSQQARPSSPRRAIPVVLAPARPPRIYYIGPPPPPPRPPKRWEHTIPSAPGESWTVASLDHHVSCKILPKTSSYSVNRVSAYLRGSLVTRACGQLLVGLGVRRGAALPRGPASPRHLRW